MRRPAALAILILAVLFLAAGGSAATSTFDPSAFVGEWTPDTSSSADLAGQSFTFQETSEAAAIGAMNRGPSDPNFAQYCSSSTAGVAPVVYFVFTYSWDGGGQMGGCHSAKTGPHIYFWGSYQHDVGFVHLATAGGEDVLKGQWTGTKSLTFTAHHPLVRFAAHVKYTVVGKKGGKVAELITAAGSGGLTIYDKPVNCINTNAYEGIGAITLKIVKVGGPSLVELDSVTLGIGSTHGSYRACDSSQSLQPVPVVVKASDPAEKDACPVGSPGTLYLTDHSAGSGADTFSVEVAKCHLAIALSSAKAKKGSHVAVAVTFDEKGY